VNGFLVLESVVCAWTLGGEGVATLTNTSSEARRIGDLMTKPSLFIGSSSEGLDFARAARFLLTQDAEVTVWREGFFALGSTYIEALMNSLPRFDFAILVFTPDDAVNSREIENFGPRSWICFPLRYGPIAPEPSPHSLTRNEFRISPKWPLCGSCRALVFLVLNREKRKYTWPYYNVCPQKPIAVTNRAT
jgi:predicted nucleotide-binding protein with TIR-like domain